MTTTDDTTRLPLGDAKPVDVKAPDADDLTLWSVTTIIGVLDKPALVFWAANQTAQAAVAAADSIATRIAEDGEEETAKWLAGARFRRPRGELSAASTGTAVHALAEDYALTGRRPDIDAAAKAVLAEAPRMSDRYVEAEAALVLSIVDRFDEFLNDFSPTYLATEVTVYSPTYGYAGTADAFLSIDGVPLICDYKTARTSHTDAGKEKGPYPEVALQLAAYRHADLAAVWRARRYEQFRRRYYPLSHAEQSMALPVPEVAGGVVLHLTPDRYALHPVRCDWDVWQGFLFTLEAARFQFQIAKDVIGPAMAPTNPNP